MTDPLFSDDRPTEQEAKRARRATLLNVLLVVVVASIFSTTVTIVAVVMKSTQTNELVTQQQRDHATNVCLISVFHQISASSGKSEQERKDAFNVIFGEKWLIDHCALTPDEARAVVTES